MYKHIIKELQIFAKHLNLLIVEDERVLGNELTEIFSLMFKKVSYADNGEVALEMYKKGRYDIVITDVNMPKMNGIELSRNIRILNKEQVIIVLSGHIDVFVIDLIDIGIQSLILKPYVLESFLQKILQQSENIVLKKAFNKIKLSKTSEDFSDVFQPKLLLVNSIAKELVESKKIPEIKIPESEIKEIKIPESKEYEEIDSVMWEIIKEDILHLNYEYEDVINYILLNGFNEKSKEDLIKIFDKYFSTFILLSNVNELAIIFSDLKELMISLDLDSLEKESMEVFDILEFFYEDIINFFNVVFIDKETKNINYLTDSLKSSVVQMKYNLGLATLVEDEFEFF